MNVYMIVDRPIQTLFPYEGRLEVAMLPLGGRPILEHNIALMAAHVADLTVVLPQEFRETSRYLSSNTFPQLNISRIQPQNIAIRERALFVRGDIPVASKRLDMVLQAWKRDPSAVECDTAEGLTVLDPGAPLPTWQRLQRRLMANSARTGTKPQQDNLSPASYHRLAIETAARKSADFECSGWQEADGLRMGIDARVMTRNACGDGCIIGARSYVDRDVVLGSGVVIGDDCIIGRSTQLENCVVLPGTCVGRGLKIRDAIIGSNWLYDATSGRMIDLEPTGFLRRQVA